MRLQFLKWLLPLGAFLLGLIPGVVNQYWWGVCKHYKAPGNRSCALARGYAREFEKERGRRPEIAELAAWATTRFRKDLERMELDRGPEEPGFTERVSWRR